MQKWRHIFWYKIFTFCVHMQISGKPRLNLYRSKTFRFSLINSQKGILVGTFTDFESIFIFELPLGLIFSLDV